MFAIGYLLLVYFLSGEATVFSKHGCATVLCFLTNVFSSLLLILKQSAPHLAKLGLQTELST